jgi:hypothetical protein
MLHKNYYIARSWKSHSMCCSNLTIVKKNSPLSVNTRVGATKLPSEPLITLDDTHVSAFHWA